MSLDQILILACLSIATGLIGKWRSWSLFLLSVFAVFALQPALPIRGLDFWLPGLTLAFCFFGWAATRPTESAIEGEDKAAIALLVVLFLGIGLNRYFPTFCCLSPSIPPPIYQIGIGIVFILLISLVIGIFRSQTKWLIPTIILGFIGLFILLKSPEFSLKLSGVLRLLVGQRAELATQNDIQWLGFSYITFRLIHILFDRLAGRLPNVTLKEMITFIVFFPALPAGPIDRIQRFIQDDRRDFRLNWDGFSYGLQRFIWGAFKKFALADSLALIALNDHTAALVKDSFWSWIILYSYAIRIYLDFSGYTDIAIGLGTWAGIKLPENFNNPYLKPNLTQFWNAWHITLAQWFRAYFFNPLTRWFRTNSSRIPVWFIILITQTTTMLLIGLWHGLTLNFAAWGLWHGLGLFLHNRWHTWVQPHLANLEKKPWGNRMMNASGTFITFNFVAFSWIWFAISEPAITYRFLLSLLGKMAAP